jgi:2-polyprenyl-3-methyl-5-hydroxy-6-metoxy-1,4-benzoquinol methylase
MEDLDKIYKEFGDGPMDYMYFQFNMGIIREYLEGKDILEMSTNIYSTLELCRLGKEVLTIDGSSKKINDLVKVLLSRNVTNSMCVAAYFEEWFKSPFKRYDEVVLFRALEHVDDPVEVLSLVKNSLKSNGHINISVPNANLAFRRRVTYLI